MCAFTYTLVDVTSLYILQFICRFKSLFNNVEKMSLVSHPAYLCSSVCCRENPECAKPLTSFGTGDQLAYVRNQIGCAFTQARNN